MLSALVSVPVASHSTRDQSDLQPQNLATPLFKTLQPSRLCPVLVYDGAFCPSSKLADMHTK